MSVVVELMDDKAVRIISDACEAVLALRQGLDLVVVESCDLIAQTVGGVAISEIHRRNAARVARVKNLRSANPDLSWSEIFEMDKLNESTNCVES